jgi:hypothetical protein
MVPLTLRNIKSEGRSFLNRPLSAKAKDDH